MSTKRIAWGRRAERAVAWWLRARGWSIVARNARIAGVEIDLVARRGRVEALVEVKSRSALGDGRAPLPLDRLVTAAQRARLARAARARAAFGPARRVRVDLVEVLWRGRWPRIRRCESWLESSEVGGPSEVGSR